MAFFKLRWPGQNEERSEQAPVRRSRMAQAESVEDLRRRARHRLIGAAVLVVAGVIVFPMLFDTQPRPIAVDVPIEVPGGEVAPMMVPGSSVAAVAPVPAPAQEHNGVGEGEELVASNAPVPLAVPKPPEPPRLMPVPAPLPDATPVAELPAPKPLPAPAPVAQPEPPKPAPAPKPVNDAERARALLEGRTPPAAPSPAAVAQEGRFVVQVGAFADASKAQEVRSKLERAGLKTYTQVVETADGKRTRVRVGPFGQRSDAEGSAQRIKALGLAASVLTL